MSMPTWFDPKVTIGSVISIITIAVALVVGWTNFQTSLVAAAGDIVRLEAATRVETARIDREIEKLAKQQALYSDQRQNEAVRLARIEERLIAIQQALAARER